MPKQHQQNRLLERGACPDLKVRKVRCDDRIEKALQILMEAGYQSPSEIYYEGAFLLANKLDPTLCLPSLNPNPKQRELERAEMRMLDEQLTELHSKWRLHALAPNPYELDT